ncbi:division/cell wall cluster transcriptional repressor MraZ [Acididesulfobacillus acetoxydans]|uniref:Transcriptional regulator MraZ n=1 Tax=Acididesulfobacillus acetoxydans TaxID=1561005 RepID=A0A8S0Y078_9FIRM|nr:division/cell wall cluster transcriptional repressor MraZ [Acididesulfobacillus acetoxydans]CAA7602897.1 division/cell wall cluster transcriptional repressor MraZ [Acididesulfobacillus acetoxydans]CEJ05778.1 Protein MraZ [Acididesulfobacillus acetoxydans]
MFMGEYLHTVDGKGRLIMPAKFREALGEQFIATKGLDHCLFVYPQEEWKILEEKLRALPFTQPDVRAFVRFFFSGASECEVDKQGRILLPANLRSYAQITKDVVLVGVSTRVEIWSQELWAEYSSRAEEAYAQAAESLVELGI